MFKNRATEIFIRITKTTKLFHSPLIIKTVMNFWFNWTNLNCEDLIPIKKSAPYKTKENLAF